MSLSERPLSPPTFLMLVVSSRPGHVPVMSLSLRESSRVLLACFAGTVLASCAGDGPSNQEDQHPSGGAIGMLGTGGDSSTATGGKAEGPGPHPSGGSASTGGQSSSTGTGGASHLPGNGGMPSTGGDHSTGGDRAAGGASGGDTGAGGVASTGGSGDGTGGSPGTGGSMSTCPTEPPLSGGTEYCSNGKGNAGSGYGYELWADGGGSGCMTVYGVDATFGASWSEVEDFLARVGLDFNQTQTHRQIGTISAEFAETKEDDGGLTYIGIYGWTVNPLREFYILDDWGTEKPGGFSSDGTPRDEVGTLVADGETYDVWKKTRVDKPAITGDSETFDQYFSIRRTPRSCGTISVSQHFEQWEELGLDLGQFHEVKLLLEAQFNSGSIEFTTAKVTVE